MEFAAISFVGFFHGANAHQCSPASYLLLYCIAGVVVIGSVCGLYVWRRMFPSEKSMERNGASQVDYQTFCR